MKALVGAFNQEKALVRAFSVIVKTDCETDGALHSTSNYGSMARSTGTPVRMTSTRQEDVTRGDAEDDAVTTEAESVTLTSILPSVWREKMLFTSSNT